jgi:hypothetical protein
VDLLVVGDKGCMGAPLTQGLWERCGIRLLIVLAINFLGDGLRDALDPYSRAQKHFHVGTDCFRWL